MGTAADGRASNCSPSHPCRRGVKSPARRDSVSWLTGSAWKGRSPAGAGSSVEAVQAAEKAPSKGDRACRSAQSAAPRGVRLISSTAGLLSGLPFEARTAMRRIHWESGWPRRSPRSASKCSDPSPSTESLLDVRPYEARTATRRICGESSRPRRSSRSASRSSDPPLQQRASSTVSHARRGSRCAPPPRTGEDSLPRRLSVRWLARRRGAVEAGGGAQRSCERGMTQRPNAAAWGLSRFVAAGAAAIPAGEYNRNRLSVLRVRRRAGRNPRVASSAFALVRARSAVEPKRSRSCQLAVLHPPMLVQRRDPFRNSGCK